MQTGDKVPDFSLYDDTRNTFTLYESLKKGPVLLLFFPAAFTGTCTSELNEVNNDLVSYDPATVFGISTDAPFTLAEYSKVNMFQIRLLSDHEGAISSLFHCKYESGFAGMNLSRISKRGAFVIDEEGFMRYSEVLEDARRIPDLVAIRHAIGELK